MKTPNYCPIKSRALTSFAPLQECRIRLRMILLQTILSKQQASTNQRLTVFAGACMLFYASLETTIFPLYGALAA